MEIWTKYNTRTGKAICTYTIEDGKLVSQTKDDLSDYIEGDRFAIENGYHKKVIVPVDTCPIHKAYYSMEEDEDRVYKVCRAAKEEILIKTKGVEDI